MTAVMTQLRLEEKSHALIAYFNNTKILDETRISLIGKEIAELIESHVRGKRLILDFSGVAFISSAMIGRLVLLSKASKAAGVDLRLRNIRPPIMQVFRITRLTKVFQIGEGDYGEHELADASSAASVLGGPLRGRGSPIGS